MEPRKVRPEIGRTKKWPLRRSLERQENLAFCLLNCIAVDVGLYVGLYVGVDSFLIGSVGQIKWSREVCSIIFTIFFVILTENSTIPVWRKSTISLLTY